MKTNVFLNAYQHPENKLTYNFLSVLELLNSKELCEFLIGEKLAERPIQAIKTVYGGGVSNPDGSFLVKKLDGEIVTVYFENKTRRLALGQQQLANHLNILKPNDKLLVITPRVSDKGLVQAMGKMQIIFHTWQDVALQIGKEQNVIGRHFVEYGKMSGEFEELGEIDHTAILLYCESFNTRYERKIEHIMTYFHEEIDLVRYGIMVPKRHRDLYGRMGTEFIAGNYDSIDTNIFSFGQFITIGYYYDDYDHGIPFKKNQPEICVFFDVNPSKKMDLQKDLSFTKIMVELEELGFDNNLSGNLTTNSWRLFCYRRPISEFESLSAGTILLFVDEVFTKLLKVDVFQHPYFLQMQYKKAPF